MRQVDDTTWYLQLLKRREESQYLFAGLDVKEKEDRKRLTKRLCKYQPNLTIKLVTKALKNLAERFGRIPALKLRKNFPESKKEELTKDDIMKIKKNERIIRHLESLPQHPQRSPGWFKDRMSVITASSGATAMDEHKHKLTDTSTKEKIHNFILNKCGVDDKFTSNMFTHHGVKYEDIAILIYERRRNVKVKDFGLILHPDGKVLGASPDGIVATKRPDGSFTKLGGRMVEIKCVVSREIHTSGDIDGDICPHYYWVQVQLQLECCNLEECDFWQCKLVELSRDVWEKEIDGDGMSALSGLEMGAVVELMPRDKMQKGENCQFEAKYIYPPRAGMSVDEIDEWIAEVKEEIKDGKLYKDNEEDPGRWYDYYKPLYWRLDKSHCQLILRDRVWFEKAYAKLEDTWSYVTFFRENKEALDAWYDFTKSKKGLKSHEIMQVAKNLRDDTRGKSYLKELQQNLKDNPYRIVTYKDISFGIKDLASLVADSEDEQTVKQDDKVQGVKKKKSLTAEKSKRKVSVSKTKADDKANSMRFFSSKDLASLVVDSEGG